MQKLFKYGIAALLLAIPLYLKFPLFNVPKTYVAVRLEDFLLLILFVAWFFYFLQHDKKEFLKSKLTIALFLFVVVGFLSVVNGIFLTGTVVPHLGFLHFVRRLEYIFPLLLGIIVLRKMATPRFFLETLFIAGFVVFLYGLGQIYAGFPVISTQNEEYAKGLALQLIPGVRIHSTFAGHYDLAAFLVLLFPLAFAYLFTLKRFWQQILFLGIFILPPFWLFLQTESRISFVSYLIGVTITLWVIKRRIFIFPFLIVSLLGMFFFSDLGSRYTNTIQFYKERVSEEIQFPKTVYANNDIVGKVLGVEDRSTSIRLNVEWPRALRAFFKNPILGTGYSSITLATDNDYLRMLGETGIAGALAFLLVLLRVVGGFGKFLRSAEKFDMRTAFVGGFAGSLAGMLVNATFIDVFEASKVAIIFWTLAGIAVGIVAHSREEVV